MGALAALVILGALASFRQRMHLHSQGNFLSLAERSRTFVGAVC